ncbi:zinc finger protein 91 isoform X2 [Dendroctonus ponderosae]|uniref:zinc finger protein 91 isoform X2 n=1 Tax=Dendroctonus ponderosae TaxID=77166 RepID=UPI002034F251|nr:zinc finger protein 91 isoform X2 [Dendroctonus ponderosae]
MEERQKTLRKMKICRFCFGGQDKELRSIYQKEPKTVPLPLQIMSCVSIEVFPNDGFPELICNECAQQTLLSYTFKRNCRKADDALKKFLMTGELIKPHIEKSRSTKPQKCPSSDHSPNETLTSNTKKKESKEAGIQDVKKIKLNDGTEVITLCISPSDDVSQHSEEMQSNTDEANIELDEVINDEPSHSKQGATDVFACEHCNKTFLLEQLLDLHVTSHHRERTIPCPQCDTKFFSKSDMTKHQLTHTGERPFSCSVCKKDFSRESLLRRHELTHTDTPNYMCSQCEKMFVEKSDLNAHMRKHQKNRPFACTICHKSFVFKQGLDRHMGSEHSGDKPFKCNYCDAAFSSTIRLTRHITTHAGLRPYPCKICSRTFLLSHHLTRHMRSHYEKQPEEALGRHKCDICSMSFKRKDNLINHSLIHSMVNLRCAICYTAFDNVNLVRDHINSHLQGLPHQCQKCDYSFETEKQLVRHELKHAEMEYEEQIEKEVISEVNNVDKVETDDYFSADDDDISHFQLDDFANPSITLSKEEDQISIGSIQVEEAQTHSTEKHTDADGLKQFFESEAANLEDEQDLTNTIAGFNDEESQDSVIKPIYRSEGTKMYKRKGPIQRKIPKVQLQTENAPMAELDEINEPLNMQGITADSLSNFSSKKPVNMKVGDKVVKVQKFIISKDEMKQMAKLGILEVKNGQVLMKSPGQPILNAKIKPIQQSDIDSLIHSQKQNKPQIKQYERKPSSTQSSSSASARALVDSVIADFD